MDTQTNLLDLNSYQRLDAAGSRQEVMAAIESRLNELPESKEGDKLVAFLVWFVIPGQTGDQMEMELKRFEQIKAITEKYGPVLEQLDRLSCTQWAHGSLEYFEVIRKLKLVVADQFKKE